jgi:hypothetical protein
MKLKLNKVLLEVEANCNDISLLEIPSNNLFSVENI